MTVISKKDARDPPQRRKTVRVDELGGEVVLQALTLTDALRIGSMDVDHRLKVPHILAAGVLGAEMTPIYTAEQWDRWGSVDEHRLVCLDLAGQIGELSASPKKTSPQTSDSP